LEYQCKTKEKASMDKHLVKDNPSLEKNYLFKQNQENIDTCEQAANEPKFALENINIQQRNDPSKVVSDEDSKKVQEGSLAEEYPEQIPSQPAVIDVENPKQIINVKTITNYFSLYGRNLHDLKPNDTGKISCTDCSHSSVKRTDVAMHILTKHVDMRLKCDECSMIFNGLHPLQYHKRAIHEGLSFSCVICPYKGSTRTNLRKHVTKHH